MTYRTKDTAWIKQAFLQLAAATDATDTSNRIYTTAGMKFVDTSLGGNFVINPLPQYTKFCDMRYGGVNPMKPAVERPSATFGMGRYYSEAIDDHNQIITMRFGVPQFNSLWGFYSAAVNAQASLLARTGRGDYGAYTIGQALGYAVATVVGGIPMFLYKVYRFLRAKPVTRYYYLKPAMTHYWNAVSSMLNTLAVNMGIAPYAQLTGNQQALSGVGGIADSTFQGDSSDANQAAVLKSYAAALPGIFRPDGRIDVFYMATRAQRAADLYYANIKNIMESNSSTTSVQQALSQFANAQLVDNRSHMAGIEDYVKKYFASIAYSGTTQSTTDSSGDSGGGTSSADGTSNTEGVSQWQQMSDPNLWSLVQAEMEDGSAFVSFRVDATGPVSESFSNQTGELGIAQKINSTSAQARSAEFDMAGGNVDGGAIQGAVDAVKGFVNGALSAVHMSSLTALAGSAFIDFPESWQSSVATMPSSNYTITLRCPYGNKVARYMYLYVPLCMILAGALPLATGPMSYTSPFICELYSRYRSQIRLGIIDSLSITRGGGNLPFGVDDGPLQIDITISVKDLSSILYMPIAPNVSLLNNALASGINAIADATGAQDPSGGGAGVGDQLSAFFDSHTYDEDNSFTDYMAVLGGLSLTDQIYSSQKWRLNMAKQMLNYESWRSPGQLASTAIGSLPGRWLSALARYSNRP